MTSRKKNRQRVGVLVLGMHRSGTSLLSRLLSLHGCDLPENLLPANESNSAGYWESATILEFNDQLLASGGSKWHDWLSFNPGWYDSPRKDEYLDRASSVLKQEFGNSGLFVLKDPRICRLTPFWLEALEQEGISPAIVVPVRHPALVSRSLTLRDGIQDSVGQLLWLRHVLDAEASTRGLNRTFLTFNQLLEEWHDLPNRMSADLGIQWPRSNQVSRAEQADFINPEMAHSEIALQNRPTSRNMPDAIFQAWDIFDRWSKTGEVAEDHILLDGLHDQLNRAGEIVGEAITTGMNTNWLLREKDGNVNELIGQLSDVRAKLEDQQGKLTSAIEDREEKQADIIALRRELGDNEERLTAAAAKATETARQLEQLRITMADRDLTLQALQEKTASSDSGRQILEMELDELKNELSVLQFAMEEKEQAVLQARQDMAQADLAKQQMEESITTLTTELDDARARADKVTADNQILSEDVEKGHKAIAAAEAFSRTAEADRDKLAERCEELQARLATTESNLRQRYAELDHVRHEMDMAHEAAEQARNAEKRQQDKSAELKEAVLSLESRIADAEAANAELADVRARLNESTAINDRLNQNILSAQQRISLAEAARDEANQRSLGYDRMADTLHVQDMRLARLIEELQNVRKQADTAQRKAVEQEQELQAFSDEKRQFSEEMAYLRNDMMRARQAERATEQANAELVAELDQLRAKMEVEVARNVEHSQRLNSDLARQRDENELIVRNLRAQTDELQRKVDQQDQAYHFINQQLFDEKRLAQATIEQQQWLLSVSKALLEPGRWWVRFLSPARRERLLLRRLSRRELFDSEAYLNRYDDVARSGMNPLEHYIRHGMQEGRTRL